MSVNRRPSDRQLLDKAYTVEQQLNAFMSPGPAYGAINLKPILAATDVTPYTISGGVAQASMAWPIPGGDPKVSTIYRFTNVGFFNIAAAADFANFSLAFYGTSLTLLGTSGFNVGQLVYWVEARLDVRATGPSGTIGVYSRLSFSIPNASNAQTWTAAVNTVTVDTTSPTTFGFQFGWTNTTGSPQLFSTESSWERMGP